MRREKLFFLIFVKGFLNIEHTNVQKKLVNSLVTINEEDDESDDKNDERRLLIKKSVAYPKLPKRQRFFRRMNRYKNK